MLEAVGIAGPLVHSFSFSPADLAIEDLYAVYAGWQTEHEDIHEVDFGQLTGPQRTLAETLAQRLSHAGYDRIEPVQLGYFLGQEVLVAAASRDGSAGTAVVDRDQIDWYLAGKSDRPLGPREAYCIHKGRRLLKTFNP